MSTLQVHLGATTARRPHLSPVQVKALGDQTNRPTRIETEERTKVMTPEEQRLVVDKSETMSDEELKLLWKAAAKHHERECQWREESICEQLLLDQMQNEKREQMTPEEAQADIDRQRQAQERESAYWRTQSFQRGAKEYGLVALVMKARRTFGETRAQKSNDIEKMRKCLDEILEILTVERPLPSAEGRRREQYEEMGYRLSRLIADAKREEQTRAERIQLVKEQS
jgi:hypothetical protein